MSAEVQPEVHAEPPIRPEFLDVTGLPGPVIEGLRTIVDRLRDQDASLPTEVPRAAESTPEARLRIFREWIAARPAIGADVRDDRETIYEARGD